MNEEFILLVFQWTAGLIVGLLCVLGLANDLLEEYGRQKARK